MEKENSRGRQKQQLATLEEREGRESKRKSGQGAGFLSAINPEQNPGYSNLRSMMPRVE